MENFTIGYLASYAGLTATTFLLVQFFKEPIKEKLGDWWVRLLAVVFALTIQLFTLYVTGNFTVEAIGLAVLNSFLIAITAGGTYTLSKTITDNTNNSIATYESGITKPQVTDISPPITIPQATSEYKDDLTAVSQ